MVHVEFSRLGVEHGFNLQVIRLVGVEGLSGDDAAHDVAVDVCPCRGARLLKNEDAFLALHEAAIAHLFVGLSIRIVVRACIFYPTRNGVGSSEREVDGNPCGWHAVQAVAEIELCNAAVAVRQDAVAHLIRSPFRHGRQGEHQFPASHALHLVAAKAAELVAVGVVIHKGGAFVDAEVADVLVLRVVGKVYPLVPRVSQRDSSNVVVHHFRKETHAVHTYAGAGQVVARLLVVCNRRVDLVEIAVEGRLLVELVCFAHDSRPHFVRVAAQLVPGAVPVVVERWKAVEVDALRLRALEDLEQASLAHRDVILHHRNGEAARRADVVVAFLVVMEDETVGRELEGQYVVGGPLVE